MIYGPEVSLNVNKRQRRMHAPAIDDMGHCDGHGKGVGKLCQSVDLKREMSVVIVARKKKWMGKGWTDYSAQRREFYILSDLRSMFDDQYF